ncbi:Polynucleotide adenylyltransferase [Handroanthus impetiginosus]|uniref:Polynucleotide adenylyltransferase n=1 Tax=Handroanthus impetiginosus TaxID=429701 RepID=A0A2G9GRB0_9LAMI|nr:Polynucleotide adenylyltransferase [Handroanthus impetiginosus]
MTTKMGELGVVNSKGTVFVEDEHLGLGLRWKFSPPPDPAEITAECLSAAEEATEQVLNCVHPTLDSEEKRRDVIDYIQQLIKSHLSCEVVSYGSVPLKTYLPDGDIDLTVLKGHNAEETLAHDVLALLQGEEQNENAEYQVKDTHFIDAEVKLVKCLVCNIVIDISFNQLGGLSTLCFLEQVDRVVGRNHLFKRSIILVKMWCYYESRILGAHHGLISTYALETLVLYIFNLFHSSLSGPLSVLYRFLDYYSQFDWENFCISLNGPVCKSSLPDIVVKMPESGSNNLLLSQSFLKNCMEMFSVPSRGLEESPKAFQMKHLNIIDPLKENNNLGRSVNRGNFYRIQSAFKYGAHKLGQVLLQPRDKVADEINEFFSNTRARHAHQHRSSIRHLEEVDDEVSVTTSLSSHVEFFSDDDILLNSSVDDFDNDGFGVDELKGCSIREVSEEMASEGSCSADGALIIGQHCLAPDKHSLPTSNSSIRNDMSECFSSSNCSASDNHFKSSAENGSAESQQIDLSCSSEKFGYNFEINNTHRWCLDSSKVVCLPRSSSNPKAHIYENLSLDFRENDSKSTGGESEAFNPLADLGGDYDSHIRSLLCGQLCYGFGLSAPLVCKPPSSPARTQNKRPWDVVRRSMPLTLNNCSQMDPYSDNIVFHGADSPFLGTSFQIEGHQKTRGTGTYFPNMSVLHVKRSSYGRGRNKAPSDYNHLRRSNSLESSCHEVSSAQSSRYQGRRKRPDVHCQSPRSAQINGHLSSSCRIEFGSIGNIAEELISSSSQDSSVKIHGSTTVVMPERVAGPSIHLKNEDEFPPLCH